MSTKDFAEHDHISSEFMTEHGLPGMSLVNDQVGMHIADL